MTKGRPDPNQSLMLDKFIEENNLDRSRVSEEFPVGIRRFYKAVNGKYLQGEIHEHLEKKLYKFGPYNNDIKMLNCMQFNWVFGRMNLSYTFGFLTYVNSKSIDAVYINGKEAWIMEIKTEKADKTAINQVNEYADLFKEDYPGFEDVERIIIANQIDRDVEIECRELRIEICEVNL